MTSIALKYIIFKILRLWVMVNYNRIVKSECMLIANMFIHKGNISQLICGVCSVVVEL